MVKRLLLVEDEAALLSLVEEFFTCHGYEVQCAAEAEEAVALIRHHSFDLVISDLELNSIEGLNGFSVLRVLRQLSPATKVIVYSGHADQAVIQAVLRHGGDRFLAKPLSMEQLFRSAEELCLPC